MQFTAMRRAVVLALLSVARSTIAGYARPALFRHVEPKRWCAESI